MKLGGGRKILFGKSDSLKLLEGIHNGLMMFLRYFKSLFAVSFLISAMCANSPRSQKSDLLGKSLQYIEIFLILGISLWHNYYNEGFPVKKS